VFTCPAAFEGGVVVVVAAGGRHDASVGNFDIKKIFYKKIELKIKHTWGSRRIGVSSPIPSGIGVSVLGNFDCQALQLYIA
jgi:hypothetical protein